MRITSGILRNRRLTVPKQEVRPTMESVREAVFSSLGGSCEGRKVLDLFAGSGALGLEAASRGAESVTFVEAHRPTADLLKKNTENVRPAGVDCGMKVQTLKTEAYLRTPAGPFDLILIDPPYAFYDNETALHGLWEHLRQPGWLSEEALVVVEHPKRTEPGCGEGWSVLKRKDYGGTLVSFVEVVRSSRS